MNSKSKNKIGVLKEIDNLGRLVIPKEFRERLNLDKRVELVLTEEGILIRNSMYELISKEKFVIEKTTKHPLE